jgi:hypothetical protein
MERTTVDTRAAVLLEAFRFIRDPESKFDAHHLIAWVLIGSKQVDLRTSLAWT